MVYNPATVPSGCLFGRSKLKSALEACRCSQVFVISTFPVACLETDLKTGLQPSSHSYHTINEHLNYYNKIKFLYHELNNYEINVTLRD